MTTDKTGQYQYEFSATHSGDNTFYLIDKTSGQRRKMLTLTVVWTWWLVIGSGGFVLLVALIVTAAIVSRYYSRVRARSRLLRHYQPLQNEIFQISDASFPSELSVNYDEIKILEEHLARGPQGEVSVGIWKSTKVVVKRYAVATGEELEYFLQEATLLKSLRHPNIVQLLGICPDPLAIVMEFVARGSLFSLIHSPATAATIKEAMALSMALDIARGMTFLHSRSILHRDLKSSNLLVTEGWMVKIADFGLSRSKANTMTMAVGTPRWTAPEVFSGHYSEKADVFSFAIVLWELIEKKIPFEELKEISDVRQAVMAGQRPPMSKRVWPEELRGLVLQCWDQNPNKRPSFEAIIETLTGLGSIN